MVDLNPNVLDLSVEASHQRTLEQKKAAALSFLVHMNRAFKGINRPSKARAVEALKYAGLTEDDLR